MLFTVGAVVVFLSVFGGYAAMGGQLDVLWQPFEGVIICGAAAGAYLIANPMTVLTRTMGGIISIIKGPRYDKDNYIELLRMMYQLFRLAKTKGMLALEPHIENPDESELFAQFPSFQGNHHVLLFLCDYLRMISLGTENPHEIETLMDEEIETHHHELHQVASAVQVMADGLPALGIVAAVLGIIKTMGSITEPPEVLGAMIGGALVGTFLGVFVAYGFVGPIANAMTAAADSETKYYYCIKAGLLAYLSGHPPAIAIEFARKALLSEVRPTFYELEDAVADLPAVAA